MKVLVTGSSGQLGRELCETLSVIEGYEVIGYDKFSLDITEYSQVKACFVNIKPNVIVNVAAYTNVDNCEKDYHRAYLVNTLGVRNVARGAELVGAKIIHISTDFVFDGAKNILYSEDDLPNPLSVYGKTKLEGECAIINECKRYFIVRTSWLYGKYGENFVKTIIKLGIQNGIVKVVIDQLGSPTYTKDLIVAIRAMLNSDEYGTYHFANRGVCSWNEFAKAIFGCMGIDVVVNPIMTSDLARLAVRPAFSALDSQLIEKTFGLKNRNWEAALKEFIDTYYN